MAYHVNVRVLPSAHVYDRVHGGYAHQKCHVVLGDARVRGDAARVHDGGSLLHGVDRDDRARGHAHGSDYVHDHGHESGHGCVPR